MENKILKKQKNRTRLKHSILTRMIVVPFIPFILALGVSFYYFTTALENKTVNSLTRIVEDHREMIESFLMERTSDLALITNTYDFHQMNSTSAMSAIFENLKQRSNAFVDLGIFDSKGVHIRYSGKYPLTGKDYKDEVWFKKVMNTGYYISDVFLGYRNVPHFIIAVKQTSRDDSWVLRATIDTQFFDQLVSKVRIGKTGEAYILNKTGVAQTRRRSGDISVLEEDPQYSQFPVFKNSIHTFIQSDNQQNRYLYAATGLKNGEWLLVVRQEKKDAYAALYKALYLNLMIMVVGGAVIVIMAVYMTERILKNIDQLGMEKEVLGHQLIRAAQLAEIGEMAAGFAHEINNPLQIVKSEHALIESCLSEFLDTENIQNNDNVREIKDSLDQIKLQVNRCSNITQAILKFGRKNEIKEQLLNPGIAIPEIIAMVEKKAAVNGITIENDISRDIPGFMGDPSQFQQVMLNLLNNAFDAVTDRHGASGGRIGIRARKNNDHRIDIEISDNGSGICSEDMGKVFSPFFTTKPVGKGTGLGLSVCYGIIESFGGTMQVESQQNVGTKFIINLPTIHS